MKVVALAGGTGSAKILRGLSKLPVDLTSVVNVGDNAWFYGVYVCPDIDIATYTLAGIADRRRGWGITGDTFTKLHKLSERGEETWFRLGDRDFAYCRARTKLMERGATLTEATEDARKRFKIPSRILPVTDKAVETWIETSRGPMHLQEFWVKNNGRPKVNGVVYRGARTASPTKDVKAALDDADRVIVCPANPVTSIGPMLAIRGLASLLRVVRGRVVSLSPMVGSAPFSGPAKKLLKAMRIDPDSFGVAGLYREFLDAMIISNSDSSMAAKIRSLGIECSTSDTMIGGASDEVRLAKELLEL